MPISRLAAEAAVAALNAKKAGDLFVTVQQNPHAFEKHFTKAKAHEAAAPGAPQGYFKRLQTITVDSKADFDTLSDAKKQAVLKQINAKKPAEVGKMLGRYKLKNEDHGPVARKTHAVDTSVIFDVVRGVFANATFYENAVEPNSRFMAVSPMPRGFIGRSIDAAGAKTTQGLDYAVVIVNAGVATNPQVVTVFPATAGYIAGRQVLV